MPRQKFGQHFLIHEGWQRKIVDYFQPPAGFAEIGPGRGAITKHLSARRSGFQVFEIDQELWPLHENQSSYELIKQDFLDWDFKLNEESVSNFSLIGNLPYESGTQMLINIVKRVPQISHFVFMLQKEVVDRICARPGTKDYSSLTVLVRGQYEVESSGEIKASAFRPPPKVISKVIRARLKSCDNHPNSQEYRDFLKQAFVQKRKTLRNCLREGYSLDKLEKALETFQLSDSVRAEQIELNLWPELFTYLK